MVCHRYLDTPKKWRIVGALSMPNVTVSQVQDEFGVSQSTASRLMKKWRETGTVSNRPRSGRPRALDAAKRAQLVEYARMNPSMPFEGLARHMNVSVRTVRNALVEAGLRRRGCRAHRNRDVMSLKMSLNNILSPAPSASAFYHSQPLFNAHITLAAQQKPGATPRTHPMLEEGNMELDAERDQPPMVRRHLSMIHSSPRRDPANENLGYYSDPPNSRWRNIELPRAFDPDAEGNLGERAMSKKAQNRTWSPVGPSRRNGSETVSLSD